MGEITMDTKELGDTIKKEVSRSVSDQFNVINSMMEKQLSDIQKTQHELKESMESILNKIDGDKYPNIGLSKIVQDHEGRIDTLERWQLKVIAIYLTVAAVFSILSPIVYNLITS